MLAVALLVIVLLLAPAAGPVLAQQDTATEGAARSGAYVFRAAGCAACHTDTKGGGPMLGGGGTLDTPFGTFYPPNITPDREHGIGGWSKADFVRALRQGVSPDGKPYYPAFPYTSYTGMTDEDVEALWTYLRDVPPAARSGREHDLDFPFDQRWSLRGWQWLFFSPGRFEADPDHVAVWNRGAYLVRHVGHCGECHTPRSFVGAMKSGKFLQGTPKGPDGDSVPNIRADDDDGLGRWSRADIISYLKTGILPDGDVVGGAMKEVIEQGTSKLSESDRAAIAVFLASPDSGQ